MIQQHIWSAKDNALLLSMPLKPSTILSSRLVSIIAINLLYALVILLPATVVYALFSPLTLTAGLMALFGFFCCHCWLLHSLVWLAIFWHKSPPVCGIKT